jgi:Domain of unknown function (DUF4129)
VTSVGPTRSEPRRLLAGLGWVPVVLTAVAEAAWIATVAGLVQEFALRTPVIGLPVMAAFVGLGAVAARVVAPRAPDRWSIAAPLLVVAAALAGWLAAPLARQALAAGDLAAALAANPGGFAAAVAMLRGFAHGGEQLSLETVGRMVFWGLPGLGLLAAIGGMVADPWREQFIADATIDAVIFAGCGLPALAFAGFAEAERSGAPTWRGNPSWIGLLLVAVAVLLATAVPVSAAAGPAIVMAIGVVFAVAFVPLAVVGLFYGAGAGLRRVVAYIGVAIVVGWILSLATAGSPGNTSPGGVGGTAQDAPSTVDRIGVLGLGLLVTVLVIGGVVILARAWIRRQLGDATGDLSDERSFDLPDSGPAAPGPRRRRRARFGAPSSAIEAYRSLVADLATQPEVRREPGETPAEHARRLRLRGIADAGEAATPGVADIDALRLALLAADYGLEAYGGVPVSGAETRRAIARWRSLRHRLRRAAGSIAPTAGLDETAAATEGRRTGG